jgi:acetyl esterase/lipase
MGRLAHASTLVRTGVATGLRRLRHGPLRPGWSFMFEATVAFMKATNERIVRLDAPTQRAETELLAQNTPALKQVRREPVEAGGVPGEWFHPPQVRGQGVVLYLHGGAYVYGSTRTHGDLIARLALGTGLRVLAPNYRLAPEHPFPAQVEDAVAVYRWLLGTGVKPEQVVFAGDSAGGGLAVAAMLSLRAQGQPQPAGGVVVAPWVDIECNGASMESNAAYDWGDRPMLLHWAKWFIGAGDPRHPLASPLYADLRGLPPLFIHVGSAELQLEDGRNFAEKARAQGVKTELVVWPEMIHNFQTFGDAFPESVRGTARLCEDIQSLLRGG